MPAGETKVFVALLIAVGIVAVFLLFFVITIVSYQRKHRLLYQQKIAAEIQTLERERKKIAADLHDDIGPLLSLIKLQMTSVFPEGSNEQQIFENAGKHIDYVLHRIRTLNHMLLPHALMQKGLLQTLQEYIQQINKAGTLYVSLTLPQEQMMFKKDQEIALFRIMQEIVTNTVKHSKAKHIGISFKKEQKYISIIMIDDGIGFNKQQVLGNTPGSGIRNIVSRVELLNGDLFLESMPGKGVEYEIKIPIIHE